MPLPTFIIAGERRCGTTSLHSWMRTHPGIFMYAEADMDYFIEQEITGTRTWRDGEADADGWETSHSPEGYAAHFAGANGAGAIGQKDADLLFWRPAHDRLARFLPDTKFVIALRDPVGRAWSHYWNEVGKGREDLSFEDALDAEDDRCRRSAYARNHLSYVRRGFYAESLEHFFAAIPRDRALIVLQDDLVARPTEALAQIYEFVGVDREQGLEFAGQARNRSATMVRRGWADKGFPARLAGLYERAAEAAVTRLWKSSEGRRQARRVLYSPTSQQAARQRMSRATRRRLMDIYRPHITATEKLLNRDLEAWRDN